MVESTNLGKEWQMVTESSKERLHCLYTSHEYSDLDIVFPEGATSIKAHRLILAMSSPVFGAMLMGPLAVEKELTLPEDSPQALRKLLDYMYLDQMDLESVNEALEVYALAHKYQMESARKVCVQYILSNMAEETTLAVLETSITYEDEVLNEGWKKLLNRNPDAVMSAETVARLSKENLRYLLKGDDLKFSSEVVPFKGLIEWGKAQVGYQDKEPSGSVLREKIGDLLREVRFLTMSCDEFVDNVLDTNVLSYTECIHILRAIRGADLSTASEVTSLNPTREPRLRRVENLSRFMLIDSNRHSIVKCFPHSTIDFIENLSSSKNVYIHHLVADCEGTISIVDDKGEVIGSATSKDMVFTFEMPVALDKDKQYRITFSPTSSCQLRSIVSGSKEVRNITLSYSGAHWCALNVSTSR